MTRFARVALVTILAGSALQGQQARLVDHRMIWSQARHNAFTDLAPFRGRMYCAFREGLGHAGDRGKLRVIVSTDGESWTSAALLEMADFDLRDAALSVTPGGELLVLGGAQTLAGERRTGTFVSFSKDGQSFTRPELVFEPGRWLWRVTWHRGKAWGVSYATPDGKPWSALHVTTDGRRYTTHVAELLDAGGRPTEARLRFGDDDMAYCLHRRDGAGGSSAQLGIAAPPYTEWRWKDLGVRFGGPNFVRHPSGATWIGAGRLYDGRQRTALTRIDVEAGTMEPILELPSGGDTSYPGLVWKDGLLWVSYYSSHEGQTRIYLAKCEVGPAAEKPIEIGDRLELFVDDHLIERFEGSRLRLHHPTRAGVALRFDRPWEGAFCGYVTVILDDRAEAGPKYRMYYRGLPRSGADGSALESTCYAESDDGIEWRRPELELFEVGGHESNNVVLSGHAPVSHNFAPFLDARPDCPPDMRYRALGGTSRSGLVAFVSADGIRWRKLRDKPVITRGAFDSQNVAFWSTSEGRYVCYFRTWDGHRTISRTTSEDFITWSTPHAMGYGDTPREHLYTNQTQPYFRAPHIALGVAARFMPGRRVVTAEEARTIGVDPGYAGDCSDAVLLTSRGGTTYRRQFMEAFIRPGRGPENWVSRTNYPACGIVPTGEGELSIYVQKRYGQPSARLDRYTLRTDGFASLSAPYSGGEAITRPLRLADDVRDLVLNVSTSAAGGVRVEVQDASGNALEGLALADSVETIGDAIERVVRWKQGSDLGRLAGQTVRLRISLRDADIFSLRFRSRDG